MILKPLETKLLPPIAFASSGDAPLPHPDRVDPIGNRANLNRPTGGLWCAPVTAWAADGSPAGTTWTDWCADPGDPTGQPSEYLARCTHLILVEPLPGAQIYPINTADDLDQLVEEFPLPPGHPMRDTTPNWEALAGADWDAVYVSPAGIAANAERIPVFTPSLANWDSASVLWLRPAYRLPQEQWHPVAAR